MLKWRIWDVIRVHKELCFCEKERIKFFSHLLWIANNQTMQQYGREANVVILFPELLVSFSILEL